MIKYQPATTVMLEEMTSTMERPTNGHAYCVSKLPTPSTSPPANANPTDGQLSCSSSSRSRRIGQLQFPMATKLRFGKQSPLMGLGKKLGENQILAEEAAHDCWRTLVRFLDSRTDAVVKFKELDAGGFAHVKRQCWFLCLFCAYRRRYYLV